MALDFIAKRGPTMGATRDVRLQYARELLQKAPADGYGHYPTYDDNVRSKLFLSQ